MSFAIRFEFVEYEMKERNSIAATTGEQLE